MTTPPPPSGSAPSSLPSWSVRPVTGAAALKDYRCPYCEQIVAAGQPHVVAWPDDRTDDRRHWHSACWRKAARSGR